MYRVPRPAEMILQSVIILLLGTVFLFLDAKVWFIYVLVFGLINLIVHFVCLYNEEKESVRGLSFKERRFIKKESKYSLEIVKKTTLAKLYSIEVFASLVAIAPALKFTIFERDIERLYEFYQVDRLFLSIYIVLIVSHIVFNFVYSQKLLKSYREGFVYQLKKKNKYSEFQNLIIEKVVNKEYEKYTENTEVYNEKVIKALVIIKETDDEKELIKEITNWLEKH